MSTASDHPASQVGTAVGATRAPGPPASSDDLKIAVRPGGIQGDAPLTFDLYSKQGEHFAVIGRRGQPVAESDRRAWAALRESCLYVPLGQFDAYRQRIEGDWPALLADDSLGDGRFATAYHIAAQVVEDTLEPGQQDGLSRAQGLAEHLATLCEQPDALSALHAARPDVSSRARHMLNVALLGLLMAGRQTEPDQRASLAIALLLHDIGADEMSDETFAMEGRLPQEDWARVLAHPRRGAIRLSRYGLGNSPAAAVALAHHECWNAGGYPDRRPGEAIHPWARLCGVADAFDILTTPRPFRSPLAVGPAIQVLLAESGRRLDPTPLKDLLTLHGEGRLKLPAGLDEQTLPPAGRKCQPLETFLPLPPLASASGAVVDVNRQVDRRQHARHVYPTSVRVRHKRPWAGPEEQIAQWVRTLDLSRGGLQFRHSQAIRLGEMLEIFVPEHGGGRRLAAMVVRCQRRDDGGFGIGVRFQLG